MALQLDTVKQYEKLFGDVKTESQQILIDILRWLEKAELNTHVTEDKSDALKTIIATVGLLTGTRPTQFFNSLFNKLYSRLACDLVYDLKGLVCEII